MKIVTVVGARPQFIKAAAVSRVIGGVCHSGSCRTSQLGLSRRSHVAGAPGPLGAPMCLGVESEPDWRRVVVMLRASLSHYLEAGEWAAAPVIAPRVRLASRVAAHSAVHAVMGECGMPTLTDRRLDSAHSTFSPCR